MKIAPVHTVAFLATMALPGCNDQAPPATGPNTSALTFWGDVAPILNHKCVRCHQAGGIAPFRLDRYEDARGHAVQVAAATRAGIMPPYLVTHDGSCGEFVDDETLTEAEQATIWQWANGDQKEGTKVALTLAPLPGLGPAREWKTPTIVPVAEGGQLAELDEYRCFPLDSNLDEEAFITGYDVIPGTPALVHHVVAALVDPTTRTKSGKTNAEVMAELDQADPDRPGWPCFTGAGEGVEIEAEPAVWAPGQGAVIYPPGLGVLHLPRHRLVVQIHYNLAGHSGHGGAAAVAGLSDSTTLRLRHAASVERRLIFTTVDGLLAGLFGGEPVSLPPGQRSVKFSWSMTAEEMGIGSGTPYVDLIAVMPHMHERGVSKQVRIGPAEGPTACAANVDRWDFNWQKLYYYERPMRLVPSTRFEVTCEYDTSRDTAPILPGWGTRNEMCAAIMMMALPPGM
jgi:hypothetical protein